MRSLFVITGPMGVGKSSLTKELAQFFNVESYSFDEYGEDIYRKIFKSQGEIVFVDLINLSQDYINLYKEKFNRVFIIKLTADYQILRKRLIDRARPLEKGKGTELDLLLDCMTYSYQEFYNCEIDTSNRSKESIFKEVKQIVIKMKADWNYEIQLPRAFTGQT